MIDIRTRRDANLQKNDQAALVTEMLRIQRRLSDHVGNVCVMVAHGTPCLGPVTHTGCGALCPTYDRGCYGCFGPKETPNAPSLSVWMARLGMSELDLHRVYRTFNANAPPFRDEAERHAP